MSEFGGKVLYGHHGSSDTASSRSEEYHERLYKNNIAMFKNIPFLLGHYSVILYDFRSPRHMNGTYQKDETGKVCYPRMAKRKKHGNNERLL